MMDDGNYGDPSIFTSFYTSSSIIHHPSSIIHAGIATGQRHAAIVCNDDALEAKAILAGRATGDLVHPLVFCPEFFMSEFKSEGV